MIFGYSCCRFSLKYFICLSQSTVKVTFLIPSIWSTRLIKAVGSVSSKTFTYQMIRITISTPIRPGATNVGQQTHQEELTNLRLIKQLLMALYFLYKRVILPVLLRLGKDYEYQIQTPGLTRNVIDNLRHNISISKTNILSCFNTVLFHPK